MTTQADAPESTPRLELDGPSLRRVVTVLLVGLALAGIAAGWNGLAWAGALAGMPGPLRHLAPLIVDGALVVMTLSAVARRSRGHTARWMWATVAALVVGSSGIQVAHALETTTATTSVQLGVALAVGALPPLIVLVATHAWLDLAVASAPTKARRAKRASAATASRQTDDKPAPPHSAPARAAGSSVPAPPRPTRPAAEPTTRPVTDDDVTEALRIRAAQPGTGWGTIADQLGVSKTTLQRRAKIAEASATVVDLAA